MRTFAVLVTHFVVGNELLKQKVIYFYFYRVILIGTLTINPRPLAHLKLFLIFQVAEVRISSKGIAQSKTTASGARVPNFGFVVFEEERGVNECLKDKPIHLSDGHRLNVETKKNKPMVRKDPE